MQFYLRMYWMWLSNVVTRYFEATLECYFIGGKESPSIVTPEYWRLHPRVLSFGKCNLLRISCLPSSTHYEAAFSVADEPLPKRSLRIFQPPSGVYTPWSPSTFSSLPSTDFGLFQNTRPIPVWEVTLMRIFKTLYHRLSKKPQHYFE